MAEIDDITAEFADCCQRSREYPLTILRTEVFDHTKRGLQARLDQKGLFHSSHQSLYVRDLHDTATEFDRGRALNSVEDVERLLDPEEKDPWWRFMLDGPFLLDRRRVTDPAQILAFKDIKRSPGLQARAARLNFDAPPSHSPIP